MSKVPTRGERPRTRYQTRNWREYDRGLIARVTSVNVLEFVDELEAATAQAGLGGSCRVSLVGAGLSISPMASTPM